MKLSREILDKIQEEAGRISYGSITIILVDSLNTVDIEVNERLRFEKSDPPRPGQVVIKRQVVTHSRDD